MKATLTMCLLTLAVFQKQCNLNFASPEAIQGKVEETLQPYFQNTKSVVLPQQHAILALTCMQGAGPELVKKITDAIAQDREITQKLRMIRFAPLIGGARYQYFVIAFDTGWIWYDIDTGRIWANDPPPGASEKYREDCGLN